MAGYPTSQADFDSNVVKMKPEVHKVSDELAKCTQKSANVEPPPSFWESVGQALIGAVFPIAGIYFSVKQIEYLLNNNPEVRENLDRAEKAAADMIYELGQLLSPGNPFLMKVIADNWDAVNTKLTGASGPMDDSSFRANKTWTDTMGQRYADVPSMQKAALDGLLPLLDSMRQYMRTHADTIIQLWWDIWEEIVDFVIVALPLIAQFLAVNPLKWLEIAKSIADCVAAVLDTIKKLVTLVFDFTLESNRQIETLKASSSDVTGTHFGNWPKASLA